MERFFERLLVAAIGAALVFLVAWTFGADLGTERGFRETIERGRVTKVLDGDTVRVMTDRRPLTVRVWGVDAPELAQPFGAAARQYVVSAVGGGLVDVYVKGDDVHGRAVARIGLAGGEDLSECLVRTGSAWWYRRYARSAARLGELQDQAVRDRRGLWAGDGPIAPWDWRAGRRPGQ